MKRKSMLKKCYNIILFRLCSQIRHAESFTKLLKSFYLYVVYNVNRYIVCSMSLSKNKGFMLDKNVIIYHAGHLLLQIQSYSQNEERKENYVYNFIKHKSFISEL